LHLAPIDEGDETHSMPIIIDLANFFHVCSISALVQDVLCTKIIGALQGNAFVSTT